MFSSGIGFDTNTISKRKDTFSAGVNKTTLTWTVGKFRKFGAGECVSKTVKAGQSQQWRLSFYPKGFTSSDYVSFFVTNVGLENGDGEKIKARVTVTVKAPEKKQPTKKKAGILDSPAVTKTLDKTFSCSAHTFGFNKFAEADRIFSLKSGLIWDAPGNDISHIMDGKLSLQIEIHQFEILNIDEPELHSEVTQQGWQRIEWVIKDVKGLTEKLGPGQVLSSGDFRANGEWYIDLYPSSYRVDDGGWISIFLHSSLRQADRGLQLKRNFRFGIKRQKQLPIALHRHFADADEDVHFPSSSAISALFGRHSRTAGKQRFLSHALLAKGRSPPGMNEKAITKDMRVALQQEFVAGAFDKAGSVTLVLDILVQDAEEGQVQQMLHVTAAFQNDLFHTCAVTGRKFGVLPVFGGAQGSPSPCYVCGRSVAAAMLMASKLTRLPEFGYEVGREDIMDVLLREAEAGAWIGKPIQELKGWVNGAIARNKALREVQHGVRMFQDRVRSARSGFLCQGLDNVSDSEEEEEAGERDPSVKMTRRERERMSRELMLQREHAKRLRALRREVEDAHFSKPVCSFCVEHCKAKAAMQRVDATQTSSPAPARPGQTQSFAAGWMQQLAVTDAAWRARGAPSRGGATASASTLARGGFMCEPMELQRQCSGRHNADDPWNEDEESNTFCDVRFDRKGTLLARTPSKFHCHGTGKVFCANCVRFKAKLSEHEKDPQNASLVPVSIQVFQERQAASERIQPVSQKRAVSEPAPSKAMFRGRGDDGDDDRDSDDDDPRWMFFKGLLDQGKGLLEGNFKAAGAS